MNQRIRELFQEAIDYADKTHTYTPEEGFNIQVWDRIRFEKFAELIVRECLEQIDKIRDGCDEDGEHQQALGADWAGLAVARHFGVEE